MRPPPAAESTQPYEARPPVHEGSWSRGNPSAPRRVRRPTWWAATAALSAVSGVAGFVVTSHAEHRASTPTTTPMPSAASSPPFPAKAVEELFISATDLPAVTGLPAAPAQKSETMHVDVLTDPDYRQPRFVDSKCAAKVLSPASRWFYSGSGPETSRYQASWGKPGDGATRFSWRAAQFVSVYPAATRAADLVARVDRDWQSCANTVILGYRQDAPPAPDYGPYWSAGPLDFSNATAIIGLTQEGGGGWKMWRAVAAHNNVVIDLMVAAQDAPQTAIEAMLQHITSRIDAAR